MIFKNQDIESRRLFSNNSSWHPEYLGWENIMVINDDLLNVNKKVPWHKHQQFDILGYVVDGYVKHTDSLNNNTVVDNTRIQHMWCGDGISHSEENVGESIARYIQIWILPEIFGEKCYYESINKPTYFNLLNIELKSQNIKIYCGIISQEKEINILNKGYLYIVSGNVEIEGIIYNEGDSLLLENETIFGKFNGEMILFEK